MIYADWIRSLPCSVCEDPNVQQHHLVDIEGIEKGLSLKLDEILSIPLCPEHHDMLHIDLPKWETMFGSQTGHLAKTLLKARFQGWEFTWQKT